MPAMAVTPIAISKEDAEAPMSRLGCVLKEATVKQARELQGMRQMRVEQLYGRRLRRELKTCEHNEQHDCSS